MAETQPELQPDLLRLSAMISQYFTVAVFTDPSGPFAVQVCSLDLWPSLSDKALFRKNLRACKRHKSYILTIQPASCKALEVGRLGLSLT
jgi:hypothetical protein